MRTSAPCAGPIKGAATALDATTLVVGSHGGFVRAMALADGSVRRTSEPLGGAVFAAPTLAGAVLVVATTAGVVPGLQAATLAPLWRKAGAPVFAQPVVHEDLVIYGDVSGAVHAGPGAARRRTLGHRRQRRAGLRAGSQPSARASASPTTGAASSSATRPAALCSTADRFPGAKFFKAPVLVSG